MDNQNQPTILVKKADGTTMRMSLNELTALKKIKEIPAPETLKKVDANISLADAQKQVNKIALERREVELKEGGMQNVNVEGLTDLKKPGIVIAEVMPVNTDQEMDSEWKKDDNKSLLDEPITDLPMVVATGSTAMAKKEDAPFNFPDKISHDDIAAAQHIDHKPHTPQQEAASQAQSIQNPSQKMLKQEPKYKAPSALNFNAKPIINASDLKNVSTATIIPAIKAPEMKPVITDVKPPMIDKRSMGPIDELKNFSITDFRRLGASAEAAGAKLLDKFKSLEKDSYLLFMEGMEAWYNSPLYRQYQEIISMSLKQDKTLGQFLAQGESSKTVSLDEFKAILKINQAIR